MDTSTSKAEAAVAERASSSSGIEQPVLDKTKIVTESAVAAMVEEPITDKTGTMTKSQAASKAEEPEEPKNSGKMTTGSPVSAVSDKTIRAEMDNLKLADPPVTAESKKNTPEEKTAERTGLFGIPLEVCWNQPAATVQLTPALRLAVAAGVYDFRRNPDFAAAVPVMDQKKASAMIIEDMDRSVGEGDPGKMLCVACEEAANSVCNGCKHAWYCSRDCQVADWPLHKKVCKDFAGAGSDDNRPSPEHRRILFFPVHSTKPETKWVVYNEAADDLFGLLGLKHPDLDLFETEVRKMGLRAEMSRIPLHLKPVLANRRVDHGLVVVTYTPNDPHHGAMEEPKLVNQSINGLTKPGYWRPLPGPVVLLADARRSGASGPPKIIDIIPRDLHTFARFFNSNECVCVTDVAHYRGEVISGLRINDLKNELIVAMGVKAMIDSVSVPLCASPGFTDYPIALAFHLGLRWYIRPGMLVGRQGSYTLWGDGNLRYLAYTVHIKETQVAEEKKREEPRATDEHEAMCKYGPFAGSVLILHGSGNPVDRYHVLAFNAYYDTTYIKKATPSKEGFQKFWAGYKKELGGPVSSVPSPYKWEKADIKDKLGLFDPDAVMKLVSGQFYNIWLAMMKHVNCFSTQTWTSQ